MINNQSATQHHLLVKNQPGELLKVARFLSDSGLKVNELRVASLGPTATIRFSTPQPCVLPKAMRGLRIG